MRRCRACLREIAPGDRYWTHRGGRRDVDRDYCEECITFTPSADRAVISRIRPDRPIPLPPYGAGGSGGRSGSGSPAGD